MREIIGVATRAGPAYGRVPSFTTDDDKDSAHDHRPARSASTPPTISSSPSTRSRRAAPCTTCIGQRRAFRAGTRWRRRNRQGPAGAEIRPDHRLCHRRHSAGRAHPHAQLQLRRLRARLRVRQGAKPRDVLPVEQQATFEGFRRANGRVGTRNYIGVVTSVNCSATVARFIAEAVNKSDLLQAITPTSTASSRWCTRPAAASTATARRSRC